MVDAEEASVFFKVLLHGFNETLKIPNKFVTTIMGGDKWTKADLKSSMGKLWSVEIQEDSYGFHFSGHGWLDFVLSHDLRFGYFLVFIYCNNMSFYVIPFDLSECRKWYQPIQDTTMDHRHFPSSSPSPSHCSQRAAAAAAMVEEASVFFKVLLDGFNDALKTPNKLLRTIMGGEKWTMVELKSSMMGRLWTVEIQEDSYGFHFSGDGWRDFVRDHDLQFGFFLVFIYCSNKSFFVVPFDLSECRKWYQPIEEVEDTTTIDGEIFPQRSTSLPKESKKPKTRHFEVTIKPYHLHKPLSYLNIPIGFGLSAVLSGKTTAILKDAEGKSWMANLFQDQRNRKKFRIGSGWDVFAQDNLLEVGDVCKFEIIYSIGDVVVLRFIRKTLID